MVEIARHQELLRNELDYKACKKIRINYILSLAGGLTNG